MSSAAKSVGSAVSSVAAPIVKPIVKPIEAAVDLSKGRTNLGDALKKSLISQTAPLTENPAMASAKQQTRNINTVTTNYENLAKRYGTVGKIGGQLVGGPLYGAGKISQAGSTLVTKVGDQPLSGSNDSSINAEYKKAGVDSALDIERRGVSNPFSDLPAPEQTPVSLDNADYNAEQDLIAMKAKAMEDERAAQIARGKIGRQQSVLTSRKKSSGTGLSRSLTGLASR